MKEGGQDPFADESNDDDHDDKPTSQTSKTDQSDQAGQSNTIAQPSSNTGQFDRSDLPRIVVRDRVKDDRDDVHQLFVYEDTHTKETDARRELNDRFDTDIYKLDAREAIYRAGMQNLDDAEEILREWGADI
ncbi:hypothetical protein [Saliphagus infecundisoli]|uniref:Uncharacterized protein n=1 Tax=Saliphagus infecundisoli TaxID=1849069 RepID=A0ABD5QAQ8_9EURY|nr:hypothetical protein [Saliphagus infecundisoli]